VSAGGEAGSVTGGKEEVDTPRVLEKNRVFERILPDDKWTSRGRSGFVGV
jgi:hypothetical protein